MIRKGSLFGGERGRRVKVPGQTMLMNIRGSDRAPATQSPRTRYNERSDLSHWRKRLGDKLELLLARVAHASGALRTRDLARVTVDTTVPVSYTHLTLPTTERV